jgi:hypothetical protein
LSSIAPCLAADSAVETGFAGTAGDVPTPVDRACDGDA